MNLFNFELKVIKYNFEFGNFLINSYYQKKVPTFSKIVVYAIVIVFLILA